MPEYDFSQQSTLNSLQSRSARYWQRIAVGRSLGIYVSPQGLQFWKARYRSISGLYKETTIGLASGCDDALSFDQATAAAESWFSTDPVRSNAVSRHAIRYNGELTICPCGEEFTVGHALCDYIEWKRVAAARSHFETVVTLINHHLVPRIATLPLAKLPGRTSTGSISAFWRRRRSMATGSWGPSAVLPTSIPRRCGAERRL